MPQKKNHIDLEPLCPAGQMLEIKLSACTDNLVTACKSLQDTCTQISESIKDLTEYAVRDKERLDSLEKSRDCKSRKINELSDKVQKQAVGFATHIGEHKAGRRVAVGGLLSGPVAVSVLECIRWIFSKG